MSNGVASLIALLSFGMIQLLATVSIGGVMHLLSIWCKASPSVQVGGDGITYHRPPPTREPSDGQHSGPYRTPQEPVESQSTLKNLAITHVRFSGGRDGQIYAMLDIADSIRELANAIKEKK